MHGEASFLNDATFWYAVAVVIFLALVFGLARKGIVSALDSQIARIRGELDEAARLRAEAESMLEDYKNRQESAIKEAEGIVAEAKALAARLRKEAEIELATVLKRQEEIAVGRINMMHEDAYEDVRNFMLAEVMKDVRGIMNKRADTQEADKHLDEIIAKLPKIANGKLV